MYWVIDNLYHKQREAFICDEDELNNLSHDDNIVELIDGTSYFT